MFNPAEYVLVAKFDEMDERHLQIMFKDKVLVTVCEPSGPGDQSRFGVWIGDGLDDNDEEAEPESTFFTHHFMDVNGCWKAAVRRAYELAAIEWNLIE